MVERFVEVLEERRERVRILDAACDAVLEELGDAAALGKHRMAFAKPAEHVAFHLLHGHVAQARTARAAGGMTLGDQRPAPKELGRIDRKANIIHGTP